MTDEPIRQGVQPIAFMIMPFGKKSSGVDEPRAPSEIDFDQLWEEVFRPVLARTHTPVRADQDLGPLIIKDMIQRLAAADLVVADITLPNANVYWEVGVRQAARANGCLLVAADWSEPPFDLRQIQQFRYPLGPGALDDDGREAIKDRLAAALEAPTAGGSPVFAAVPDFPYPDPMTLEAFQDYAREVNQFHAQVRQIRQFETDREAKLRALVEANPPATPRPKAVAWQIITLLRDHAGWEAMLEYLDGLPTDLGHDTDIQEQRFLAMAKAGDVEAAIPQLEMLIEELGPSGERCGLLGGRYKQLWRQELEEAPDSPKVERYLRKAIEAYEAGMNADLNEYYSVSNLARLYRALDREDPELQVRADRAAAITLAACLRALDLQRDDPWLRPTLLVAAFDEGEVEVVQRWRAEVERESPATWQLQSVLADLHTSLDLHPPDRQELLRSELERLEAMVAPDGSA